MKKLSFTIIAILALVAAGLGWWRWGKPGAQKTSYRFQKVDRGPIVKKVIATGTLNPKNMVRVGAQVTGTIKALYVSEDDPVEKGQVIAKIDPALFESELQSAEASYRIAMAGLRGVKAKVENQERKVKRLKRLIEQQLIAQQELDDAEAELEVAKSDLASQRAEAERARAALARAKTNLDYTIIRSPIRGVVISRDVEVGQTVVSSMQAPSLFLLAEDLTNMEVETLVDEADIGEVKRGQPLRFTVDAWPERTFETTVKEIRHGARVDQNVVSYVVVADVQNPDLILKPGMTANVTIEVARRDDCIRIPNAALRFTPSSAKVPPPRDGYKFVWRLGAEGKPEAVEVRTGLWDELFTELPEGPLRPGDELIVSARKPGKRSSFMPRRPF